MILQLEQEIQSVDLSLNNIVRGIPHTVTIWLSTFLLKAKRFEWTLTEIFYSVKCVAFGDDKKSIGWKNQARAISFLNPMILFPKKIGAGHHRPFFFSIQTSRGGETTTALRDVIFLQTVIDSVKGRLAHVILSALHWRQGNKDFIARICYRSRKYRKNTQKIFV